MVVFVPPDDSPDTSPPSGSTPGGSTPGGSTPGGSTPGGGGGGGEISAAEQRAIDRENKAKARAARRYQEKAQQLIKQANALKIALGKKGYKKTLNTQLQNTNTEFRDTVELIFSQYRRGRGELEKQAATNQESRGQKQIDALSNSGRERAESLAQATAQGVGMTDMLRAQQASLRNWQSNASDVEQAYVDTQNSLESAHSELVNTVIAQRASAWRSREDDREQAYRTFYDNRGQALTEVGNKLGEASDYFGMANEQQESKLRKNKRLGSANQALSYYRRAARQTGRAYEERGIPDRIKKWEGNADLQRTPPPRVRQELETAEAEGANQGLRRWE